MNIQIIKFLPNVIVSNILYTSSATNQAPKQQSAVYIRNANVVVSSTKLSNTILHNITSLSTYTSKNPLIQDMIQSVQRMSK